MALLHSIYRMISRLSLDVVVGAMGGLLFFSKLFRADLDPLVYLLLGMAVWCIYTLDHILDARKLPAHLSSRYAFHQRWGGLLLFFVTPTVLYGLMLAYRVLGLGKELYFSLGLGGLILLTMLLVRKAGKTAGVLKELSTAVFYVLGVAWLPLLNLQPVDWMWQNLVFIPFYIGLAFLNLLMLSVMDRKEDQLLGFASAALMLDPVELIAWIRRLALVLILGSMAGFILLPSFYRPFACLVLLMTLVHYLTFFNPGISPESKRSRMEATFLLPWLILAL